MPAGSLDWLIPPILIGQETTLNQFPEVRTTEIGNRLDQPE